MRRPWCFGITIIVLMWMFSCRSTTSPSHKLSPSLDAPTTRLRFTDITAQAHLTFRIDHASKKPLNILETAGHGGAFLDYDQDGWMDILLIGPFKIALFHNNHDGTFTEVTEQAFLNQKSQISNQKFMWMGCAVGDYNNDGWPDLFVSGYHCAALYRNDHGIFVDVSDRIPLALDEWTTSAVFLDVDRDGWLDLYVGSYVRFGPEDLQLCDFAGVKAACPPTYYEPERGHLYRNLGNDRGFEEATNAFGLSNCHGKTLGVAAADYDGSGRCGLYLANDGMPGDLFRNIGNRFVNVGLESGTAFSGTGKEQAGMGVDWADYDNDGTLDLIVTTFQFEPKSLYRNLGNGHFIEDGAAAGIADRTVNRLGFGVKFFDADNDGDLDLLIANGHVQSNVRQLLPSVGFAQPPQLFENNGSHFVDVSESAGPSFARPMVGRSVAIGDINNDGKLDALITNLEGAPRLMRNDTLNPSLSRTRERAQGEGHWIMLRLIGHSPPSNSKRPSSPRDGTGALVTVRTGKDRQMRIAGTGGSYLCASDPRVHFGVGNHAVVDEITIRWPSGVKQTLGNVQTNRIIDVIEPRAKTSD